MLYKTATVLTPVVNPALGNLAYSGSSGHASHPVIATCGALSIVECDHFCDLGELGPDEIKVPGMFVDMILA